jgi:hypothetical protein
MIERPCGYKGDEPFTAEELVNAARDSSPDEILEQALEFSARERLPILWEISRKIPEDVIELLDARVPEELEIIEWIAEMFPAIVIKDPYIPDDLRDYCIELIKEME